MSAKSRAVLRNKIIQWKEWQEQHPIVMKSAALGIYLLLGFITGSVSVCEKYAPFGVAMTACSGGGVAGLACLLGGTLGYVLTDDILWAVRYIAALVLTYTTAFIFRECVFYRKTWFMPSVAAVMLMGSGALSHYESILRASTLVPLVTEGLICAVCTCLFSSVLTFTESENDREEYRNKAGYLLLFSCIIMALSKVFIFQTVNIGRTAAALSVMVAAFTGGIASGSISGILLGLATDLAVGNTQLYAICCGFSGLMGGILSKRGRLIFLISYLFASAFCVFWRWETAADSVILYETFAASVLFMILPSRSLTTAASFIQKPALGAGEAELRQYTARRARDMADSFRELYETVRRNAESETNDADIAAVYDRAAETVCAACASKGECWHRDYVDMLTMLNDATGVMRSKGQLEKSDLPERFVNKCPSLDAFLSAVNAELRALIYRNRLRTRLEENRSAAYGQFQYLAGVLDAVADDMRNAAGPDTMAERRILRYLNSRDMDAEVSVFRDHSGRLRVCIDSARLGYLYRESGYMDRLSALVGTRMCRPASANQTEGRMVLWEAEPLAVSVGVAAMKKEGEPVSGDRGTYFKTEQGVLCVLLSDGMGSGEKAARESISVVRILERFLRSGIEPGTAMRILNSVMLLKNGDNWGYATVDLMCIDLFNGQTVFYKYGAAPSYIRTGKTVRSVKGISMAAGILSGEGEAPDMVRMKLKPGGIALVASDGVVTKQNDVWLRDMLLGFDGADTREFARNVIREARKHNGCLDDMTVLVVRVEERK